MGLDSGYILVFDLSENIGAKEDSLLFRELVHTERVMGLYISEKYQRLYSIGEDGFLRCVCLKTDHIMSRTALNVNYRGEGFWETANHTESS